MLSCCKIPAFTHFHCFTFVSFFGAHQKKFMLMNKKIYRVDKKRKRKTFLATKNVNYCFEQPSRHRLPAQFPQRSMKLIILFFQSPQIIVCDKEAESQ